MVAGRSPFAGPSGTDVLAAILDREPAPLARFEPDAPPELQRIISKTLRKDREQRYQNVRDLLLDLRTLQEQPSTEFEAQARTDQSRRNNDSLDAAVHRRQSAAVAVVLAVCGAAVWRTLTPAVDGSVHVVGCASLGQLLRRCQSGILLRRNDGRTSSLNWHRWKGYA